MCEAGTAPEPGTLAAAVADLTDDEAEAVDRWMGSPDLRLGQLLWQVMAEVLPEGRMPPEVWPLCQIEEPTLMDGLRLRAEKVNPR